MFYDFIPGEVSTLINLLFLFISFLLMRVFYFCVVAPMLLIRKVIRSESWRFSVDFCFVGKSLNPCLRHICKANVILVWLCFDPFVTQSSATNHLWMLYEVVILIFVLPTAFVAIIGVLNPINTRVRDAWFFFFFVLHCSWALCHMIFWSNYIIQHRGVFIVTTLGD
jgi:hypothetical protein